MRRSPFGVCAAVAAVVLLTCSSSRADGESGRDHVADERAVRFGPAVSAGLPDGARVDVRARWRRLVTAGAGGAWLPDTSIPGASASVTRVALEGYARVHPFRGRFFLGVASGWTQLKGTAATSETAFGQRTAVLGHGYASDVYVAPHLGVVWTFPYGITAGMDVGAQIPFASRGPTFDAQKYGIVTAANGTGAFADALRIATTHVIPVFHVLELGVML